MRNFMGRERPTARGTKHRRTMNLRTSLALLALALAAASGPSALAADAPDLDFLIGTWHIPQMNLYETWEKAASGEGYDGRAVVRRDGEERVFETFTVRERDGAWVYRTEIEGQGTTDFRLTAHEPGRRAVFENPDHDMPTRLTYFTDAAGEYKVRIEGREGAQVFDLLYDLEPVEGPAAAAAAYAHVSIGVADLGANVDFYSTLGFRVVAQDNAPWPWVLLSDGTVNVQLNADGERYLGVSHFGPGAAARAERAMAAGLAAEKASVAGTPVRYFLSPDSVFGVACIPMAMPWVAPPANATGPLGRFGEVAVPVAHYDSAKAWYAALGYESTGDQTKPYPWGILSGGGPALGLHQSPHFRRPALTWFSEDTEPLIARLREAGLKVHNAVPGEPDDRVVNGVVRSPEGWPVFLFEAGR
jgi:catechol 2,3-dioxygenase-like lactoylglutathione lyase family enzyme